MPHEHEWGHPYDGLQLDTNKWRMFVNRVRFCLVPKCYATQHCVSRRITFRYKPALQRLEKVFAKIRQGR